MEMPAKNLKRPMSANEIAKQVSTRFSGQSYNDTTKVEKNITEMLKIPEIASVVEKLSKI
ncbi:hypothetical protein [Companilactobacillus ginsenosidimutans]|uniref:Uncharacterized protein n=1 Tax=Companilactobacillus ginsenosidimutans TaxID=1007676 RepID=A0A0H4QGY4_9LACO|nr:hypothetical protein [Companilactobacillus ginsenosidimutans]AKP67674.1 hypothetical protein ABM34_09135 [Companilactobacillus ginsenosidimutans]